MVQFCLFSSEYVYSWWYVGEYEDCTGEKEKRKEQFKSLMQFSVESKHYS